LQVALLADRLTERGWQPGRVHDVRQVVTDWLGLSHMELPRAVASLAADGLSPEDRLPVPVLGPFHVIELVRMTEKASRFDEPLEMKVVLLVAGGKVPFLLAGIPGDRRFEEVAVSPLQQERQRLLTGA